MTTKKKTKTPADKPTKKSAARMVKHRHTNPDGSIAVVRVGAGVNIPASTTIGYYVRIGAGVKLGNNVTLSQVEAGNVYQLEVIGWRIPFLSCYPNVISAFEQTEPK